MVNGCYGILTLFVSVGLSSSATTAPGRSFRKLFKMKHKEIETKIKKSINASIFNPLSVKCTEKRMLLTAKALKGTHHFVVNDFWLLSGRKYTNEMAIGNNHSIFINGELSFWPSFSANVDYILSAAKYSQIMKIPRNECGFVSI